VIVVPIVIQVPSYGYPMSIAMPNGGHGGLAPHLNAVYECSAKPLGASPPGFKSPPRRQRKAQTGCRALLHIIDESPRL